MAKKVTDNQLTGESGEALVKSYVGRLGHVYESRGRLETGIDGSIEFRDPRTRTMTGRMVLVQVKTTDKGRYSAETDAAFEYLMRPEDLAYWRTLTLPVVVIMYRLSDDSMFWKSIADSVPGDERRLRFDKLTDRLDTSSLDRLAALSVERGRHGAYVPPLRAGETAHLNLMRIGMPDEIFVADSPFNMIKDAVPALLRTDERGFDWVIRGRRFVSFRDPRGTGLESVIDVDTVEAMETELIADSDDPDDELVMIELLRRIMTEQFSTDLVYDPDARMLYFRPTGRFEKREYSYRSLRDRTSATVVQVYPNKKRPGEVHSVRHHAFHPRFERIGSDWFVSITPTFWFTEDGYKPHRFSADLLAGKNRKDRNGSIRGQVFMFRHLLSGAALGDLPARVDMFSAPPDEAAQTAVGPLRFEPVEGVEMEVAVPEDAWTITDPNAKRMKASNDDGPVQHALEMPA